MASKGNGISANSVSFHDTVIPIVNIIVPINVVESIKVKIPIPAVFLI